MTNLVRRLTDRCLSSRERSESLGPCCPAPAFSAGSHVSICNNLRCRIRRPLIFPTALPSSPLAPAFSTVSPVSMCNYCRRRSRRPLIFSSPLTHCGRCRGLLFLLSFSPIAEVVAPLLIAQPRHRGGTSPNLLTVRSPQLFSLSILLILLYCFNIASIATLLLIRLLLSCFSFLAEWPDSRPLCCPASLGEAPYLLLPNHGGIHFVLWPPQTSWHHTTCAFTKRRQQQQHPTHTTGLCGVTLFFLPLLSTSPETKNKENSMRMAKKNTNWVWYGQKNRSER